MTGRLLINCDGPNCLGVIDSTIHAGTWFTLKNTDIFKPEFKLDEDKHFCSYFCLHAYTVSKVGADDTCYQY